MLCLFSDVTCQSRITTLQKTSIYEEYLLEKTYIAYIYIPKNFINMICF